jgi:hypothetical protein
MFTPVVLESLQHAPVQIGYLRLEYKGRDTVVIVAASGKIIMGDEDFDNSALAAMKSFTPEKIRVHDYDWLLARFEGTSPDRIYSVRVGTKGGVISTALLSDNELIADVRKAFDNTTW